MPSSSPTPEDFVANINKGYGTTAPTIDLGRALFRGSVHKDAVIQIPLAMCNRHGLIAGATGTGKTKTLQIFAECLSDAGVPVFAADMKGDLSGLLKSAQPNPKIDERVEQLGIQYTPEGFPVAFWALGGKGSGVPVRAAISSFGPQLLAKVLDCNDTQESSLSLVFHYADSAGLALLDLSDLRAVLQFLTSDEGKEELKGIGGLSSQTAGVLLRKLIELEAAGGDEFFGEPELDIEALFSLAPSGQGIISLLELGPVQAEPRLFSTFIMWLLAELFEHLPEAGDLDKPKLVFFFDEAHLLFNGASKGFLEQVAQTVRLIRSKGIGVFFVTQLPDDVPDEVLSQLGNRVQHALRAFTPRDAKALRAAVTTYPTTEFYNLEKDLTQLGIGEAMITLLSEKGAPAPVAWTRLVPPRSLMAAVPDEEIDAVAKGHPLYLRYKEEIDRDSAREILERRMDIKEIGPRSKSRSAGSTELNDSAGIDTGSGSFDITYDEPTTRSSRSRSRSSSSRSRSRSKSSNPIGDYLGSREGRSMVNTVLRGIFGMLKKKR